MNERELSTQWFYNGMREGVREYAYWRDGEQWVGTCGITLKQALKRIDSEEQQALKKLKNYEDEKTSRIIDEGS